MDLKNTVMDALNLVEGYGDFGEVYFESRRGFYLKVEDSKVKEISPSFSEGFGIRVVKGKANYMGSVSGTNREDVLRVAREVALSAREKSHRHLRARGRNEIWCLGEEFVSPGTVGLEEKVEIALSADRAARKVSEKIVQVVVILRDWTADVEVATTDGIWKKEKRSYVMAVVTAIAKDGENLQRGEEVLGFLGGYENISPEALERMGMEAAERALRMLYAEPSPVGEMPVVLAEGAGGVLIHEAVGHGLEADLVLNRASVYAGKIGQMVASEVVTVIDDGTLPRGFGTSGMDDEGIRTKKVTLIENGRLVGYLHSRATAKIMGVEPTGNGRRQSFAHVPIPRMRNTYVKGGDCDPGEIVESVKSGLYVVRMGGGEVNPSSGDFVFGVQEAYLIEDGKVTRPVRDATLIGKGPEILKRIRKVGRKVSFRPGICGKDGQGVPVWSGMPTVLVERMIVGGTKTA